MPFDPSISPFGADCGTIRDYDAAIPSICCIDHTNEYVCCGNNCQRLGRGLLGFIAGENFQLPQRELDSDHNIAKIDRSCTIWLAYLVSHISFRISGFAYLISHSGNRRTRQEDFTALDKGAPIRGLPLASGFAPRAATRSGRSPFFGLIPSSEDPANSFLKRRTLPTPPSGT